jgi:hypothetical protein
MFSTVVVPPLAVVVVVLRRATDVRPIVDRAIVFGLLGSALLYLVVQADPRGYVTWLLD